MCDGIAPGLVLLLSRLCLVLLCNSVQPVTKYLMPEAVVISCMEPLRIVSVSRVL